MRIGDWLQTWSGVQFWPMDPRPEEIRIEDIAHSLANQCRFAGHCNEFYSVAQHSVLVSQIVAPEYALWGLLHDAAEAYLVDLPRPIKRGSAMGAEYSAIESRLMRTICERFGLPLETPSPVKRADNIVLMTEKRDLMGPSPQEWIETEESLIQTIDPWAPKIAKAQFLQRFRHLVGEEVLRLMGVE